jgi:hypothetical protein
MAPEVSEEEDKKGAQITAPLRSAIGMMECWKNGIHHSIIPGWKWKNGWPGIPYYHRFVGCPLHLMIISLAHSENPG